MGIKDKREVDLCGEVLMAIVGQEIEVTDIQSPDTDITEPF